jgi:hypothetical protein
MLQAIRLGGLVGAVYAAAPLRDYARPHVLPYLAAVPPSMLDRLLWWSSAVVSYLAIVGLGSLTVKLYRRRPYGEPEPNHADQFAGMLLAAGKAAVVAAFLVGSLDKYALTWVKQVPWATEMTKSSTALTWHEQYHPSERIWTAAPVQHFVGHVQRMGIADPAAPDSKAALASQADPVQGSNRSPRLDLPMPTPLDPTSPDFIEKLDEALRQSEQLKAPANPR